MPLLSVGAIDSGGEVGPRSRSDSTTSLVKRSNVVRFALSRSLVLESASALERFLDSNVERRSRMAPLSLQLLSKGSWGQSHPKTLL